MKKNSAMEDREKRDINRVSFRTNATIRRDGSVIQGGILDLSLKGVFVKTHDTIPVDSQVDVEIHLSGAATDLSVHVTAKVIRTTADGVALKFNTMDLDSYIFLKNIVMYSDDNVIDFQG